MTTAAEPAVDDPAGGPAAAAAVAVIEPAPGQTKVEMSVYGKSVTIETPEPLTAAVEVALQLWRHLEDAPLPVGATGFVVSEQPGPPPLEMETRSVEPAYDEDGPRDAA